MVFVPVTVRVFFLEGGRGGDKVGARSVRIHASMNLLPNVVAHDVRKFIFGLGRLLGSLRLVGLVLLLAAGLKVYAALAGPGPESGYLGSRWLQIALAEYEAVLGAYLLLGLARKVTWLLAVATFVAFFCFSLIKALSGEQSCGCFGVVPVPPWLTATVDLAILAGLGWTRPRLPKESAGCGFGLLGARELLAAALTAMGVSVMSLLATVVFATQTAPENGSSYAVLEPDRWVGQTCPLIGHIDVGPQLSYGNWVILLHRHSCPKCQRLREQCEDWLRQHKPSGASTRIACVEIPPYGSVDQAWVGPCRCLRAGKLDESKTWLIETPVLLRLEDGTVRGVHKTLEEAVSGQRVGEARREENAREALP
jgi:hypothetical protein